MISGCGRRVAGLHLSLHCAVLSAEKHKVGETEWEALQERYSSLHSILMCCPEAIAK